MAVTKIKNRFFILLFYCLIIELFLMGSGQDLHIVGPLTLRMVNFSLALLITTFLFCFGYSVPQRVIGNIIFFTYLIFFSICIGLLNDAKLENIFEDIKPLSYFFLLPFFYFILDSEERINSVYRVMLRCAKTMVIIYLGYMIITDFVLHIDISIIHPILHSDNIMFRGLGNSFYYKGFLYLPLAGVALLMEKKYLWYLVFVIAIYFTYTRGLYLLLAVGSMLAFLRSWNVNIVKIILALFLIYVVIQVAMYFDIFTFDENFTEGREDGDELRNLALNQVSQSVNALSLLIGHGFGIGVPVRPVHMEISYLEIFHKQGIVGLSFWGFFLIQIIKLGHVANMKGKKLGDFMVITAFMVYLQSFFNPYLNNPIGMGWVLLCYVSCYKLAHEKDLRYSSNI